MSLFARFKTGLAKTRDLLSHRLKAVFSESARQDMQDQLTDILLGADLGISLTERLIASLKEQVAGADYGACCEKLKAEIKTLLQNDPKGTDVSADQAGSPLLRGGGTAVFFGVNGVGKTTTIGKMACRFTREGKSVLLAAGDTFRAGAIEQLSLWGERAGAGVIRSTAGADPAAVIFDAIHAARARKSDYLLIDTAGRLQTHYNLMEALKKITRVISKALDKPYERILVLDALTGQNALSQARQFHEAVGITGIILTKLDSTARGGILISIAELLHVPILYVGMGEGIEDLVPFNADDYVNALF